MLWDEEDKQNMRDLIFWELTSQRVYVAWSICIIFNVAIRMALKL